MQSNLIMLSLSLLAPITMVARYDHICAHSNESVVKFRKNMIGQDQEEALSICLADKVIGKSSILFDWPIDLCDFWVSSLFGMRTHKGVTKMHGGVDLAALKGTKVFAAADGVINQAQDGVPGYGSLVQIEHAKGFVTKYGHLHEIMVQAGQRVRRGEVIGTVGASGNVRGTKDPSHLHFEILRNEQKVNPLQYLYCSEVAFVEK